jgi:hypothetical protein
LAGKALLAAEVARLEDGDAGFLSSRSDYSHLERAGPDVENAVRRIALGINNLVSLKF